MWTHGDVSTTVDQKRRFMAAVRSGPLMFAEIARLSGLSMRETLDVFTKDFA